MDYRIGKCRSCGAVYKVPASFSHDTAKCKQCGEVVEIGPVEAGDSKPPAAAKPPAAKAPREKKAPPVPAVRPKTTPERPAAAPRAAASASDEERPKKTRSGPSMKEQLLARRSEGAGAQPAAKPPTRSAATKKPARAAAPVEEAELEVESVETGGDGRRATRRAGASARSRSGSGRGGSSRKSGRGSDRKGRAGAGRKKKKSAAPLIGSLVGLVLVAVGAAFLFKDDLFPPSDEAVLAADTQVAAGVTPAAATPAESGPVEADPVEPEGAASEEGAQDTEAPEDDGAGDAEGDGDEDEDSGKIGIDDPNDPLLDLSTMPQFGPVDDTSTPEFEELKAKMVTYMDADAGAASGRAGRALREAGRRAMPVVLNHMRTIDLLTKEGREAASLCQRILSDICNGINYGWYFEDTVKDAKRNAKIVRKWAKEWGNSEKDIEYWIRMAKLDEKDPDQAAELREKYGTVQKSGGDSDLDDDALFDDDLLDDGLLDD